MTRILIVDDFQLMRRGIASLINEESNWKVVGEAGDGMDALAKAQELHPDVVTMDISLPKLNGLEAARRIREVSPSTRIVFFSQHSGEQVVKEAIQHEGTAYVCKSDNRDLVKAVREVLSGRSFVSPGSYPRNEDGNGAPLQNSLASTDVKKSA
jgi:DNA-binding NarL/FixJ family response regulator